MRIPCHFSTVVWFLALSGVPVSGLGGSLSTQLVVGVEMTLCALCLQVTLGQFCSCVCLALPAGGLGQKGALVLQGAGSASLGGESGWVALGVSKPASFSCRKDFEDPIQCLWDP
jgi:hypothetical protein